MSTRRGVALLTVLLSYVGAAWGQFFAPTQEDLDSAPPFTDIDFGSAVAISGGTAMIGMPSHNDIGRVGVYTRTRTGWVRTQTLLPSNAVDSGFGGAIDLDGNTAVIGAAPGAYLFRKRGSQWRQIARLVPGGALSYDRGLFARTESQSSAEGELDVVRLYRVEANGQFRPVATLRPRDASPDVGFGGSIAMARDTVVVGAEEAAYVFRRSGNRWIEVQKLMPNSASTDTSFGASVAVRDNNVILVGAPNAYPFAPDDPATPRGAVHVFLQHRGAWYESQELTGSSGHFGSDLDVSGTMAVVSAPLDTVLIGSEGSVDAFDWRGRELTSRREVLETGGSGISIADIDLWQRRLIVGIRESAIFTCCRIGSAHILEFKAGESAGSSVPAIESDTGEQTEAEAAEGD